MKKNNKGFTLAELLIVVAIIAVLVAVSIPIFNGQLTKAKQRTDDANERAAKAAAVAQDLSEPYNPREYYYNAANGTVAKNNTGISAYGQEKTGIVKVTISDSEVKTEWVAAAS